MISLITPVYNSAATIRRYMQSVMAQTCYDMEVILVDDHGSDNSMEIARTIAQGYTGPIEFRFLETPCNSGPGVARNVGIDAARGEYIAFLDSDDTLDPLFCRLMLESATAKDSDMCCCHLEVCDRNGRHEGYRRNPNLSSTEFTGAARKAYLSQYASYFTTYIYRRELLNANDIRFPAMRSSEDSMMLCCALLCSRRISQVDRYLYRYLRQPASLTTRPDADRYRHKLSSMNLLLDTARRRGWYDADKDELDFIYFKKGFLVPVFTYIADNSRPQRSAVKEMVDGLYSQVPDIDVNPYIKGSLKYRALKAIICKGLVPLRLLRGVASHLV